MGTAIVSAFVMFGLAIVISMGVALMIKVLFLTIRWINQPKSR